MLVFAVAVIAVLLPPSLSQATTSPDGHEAVALLLDAGANVNAVDYTGATALLVAAGQGLYDVVDLLVQAGANVSLSNANKATPLHAAARIGNARIVSLLVGKGANVNAVDSNGNTVLMSGAQSNSTQTVALLVAAGASVGSVNKNGWSALQVAMAASRPQIAAYLLSRNAPATLHDLCAIGNATAVRIAVQNGADVNAPATMSLSFLYTEGDSPVYVAASNGFADVIDVLARHGANVNQTNALGSSPVLAAVDRHSLAATMALIRAGANVNAVHAGVPLIEATWWAQKMGSLECSPRIAASGQWTCLRRRARQCGTVSVRHSGRVAQQLRCPRRTASRSMGNANTTGLTADDIDELRSPDISQFTEKEIRGLYERFRRLDKTFSGVISTHDFELIPELSMNPLCPRIIAMFDTTRLDRVNFRDFVRTLWLFSPRCPADRKVRAAFDAYDVDGDGRIGHDDLVYILKLLAGINLSDAQLRSIVADTMAAVDVDRKGYIDLADFEKNIGHDLAQKFLTVQI